MHALGKLELESALSGLEGWTVQDDKLQKLFKFKSFRDAVAFLVRLAFEIETMNHHPEIENVYNRVRFTLCTHDAGNSITEKDVKLAKSIEALFHT